MGNVFNKPYEKAQERVLFGVFDQPFEKYLFGHMCLLLSKALPILSFTRLVLFGVGVAVVQYTLSNILSNVL